MGRTTRARGFTLIELLVVISIIALLIGILLPALGKARQTARTTQCATQMQQFGTALNAYAVSYQDKIASFSWTKDLPTPGGYTNDIVAAAAQAVDIMRRRGGDLSATDLPQPTAWIPQILYNHLVIAEDQDWPAPFKVTICPEDSNRLRWTRSGWSAFVNGQVRPQPAGSDTNPMQRRWFFSASYNFVPAAMSTDKGTSSIRNFDSHMTYWGINNPNVVGKRKLGEVQSPGSKVVMYDYEARHFGKRSWYCVYPEARQPLLFFDGHVAIHKVGTPVLTGQVLPFGPQRQGQDVNPGWNPEATATPTPFTYSYENPQDWEAPLRNGSRTGSDQVTGYYRYTRGGLRGIDVKAAEPDFR